MNPEMLRHVAKGVLLMLAVIFIVALLLFCFTDYRGNNVKKIFTTFGLFCGAVYLYSRIP